VTCPFSDFVVVDQQEPVVSHEQKYALYPHVDLWGLVQEFDASGW
jgi:hypothetical protein